MKTRISTLVSTLVLLLASQPQSMALQSINVQTFNPSTSDRFVLLEDGFKSEWPKVAKYYFGANFNYFSDPLVVLDSTQSTKSYNVINSINTLDLFFGMKAANNFSVFIAAPVHIVTFSNSYPDLGQGLNLNYPTGSQVGFGDLKLMGKLRLTDDSSPTNISLIPEIHLPTGATAYFVSDASTYLGIRAALERQFEAWTLLVNLGYASASNARYKDAAFASAIDYRNRLFTGVGGFLPLDHQWGLDVEINSINTLPFDKALNPNDAYFGARYAKDDNLAFTAGASIGRIGGPQGEEFRVIAGLRYTIFEEQKQSPKPLKIIPATAPINTQKK